MTVPVDVRPNSVAVLGIEDGSAGQVACWFEKVAGYHIACYVHPAAEWKEIDVDAENRKRVSQRLEYPQRGMFKGRPFLVRLDWPEELCRLGIRRALPLISDNYERLRAIEMCREHGIELVSAIHPTVLILDEARIEPGVWINAGSIIGYKAEIESGVLINTAARIDHHNVLKRCAQVDPGVVTAGNVTLCECAYVHTGVVIINRRQIGAGAIIGAGAVVIDDIPPRVTAVGVPARIIRYHPEVSQ